MKIAEPHSIHANFVVIANTGVLITGKASSGKSDLSLALLDRGHALVADDATLLWLHDHHLFGKSPEAISGLIQISHVGLVNVIKAFGIQAYCSEHKVDFILHLSDEETPSLNPFAPLSTTQTLLETELNQIHLPSNTRNLPLLVETLVKNYKLKQQGYDALTDLQQRSAPCKQNA